MTQGKTILIVEDEEALSSALKDFLSAEGYVVSTAPNGAEGIKTALETHPALMLLDIMMPEMDGIAMLKELRAKQEEPKSHVIFFTNLSQMEKIAEALAAGAEGYAVKAESSLEDIVGKVKEFFEKHPELG